jgi:transcription elongation factor Elf1
MLTTSSRTSKKVCFIAGAGHSGSTLLGFILGSHQNGFYCGEAAKTRYLQDVSKNPIKRVCKICGADCVVWSRFIVNDAIDLYEQVADQVQKSLIIDSSKNIDWIKHQMGLLEQTDTQPFLIFLQRDGRAVINSRIRKYPTKNVEDLITDWVRQIQATNQLFDGFPNQKLKLKYEQLATNAIPTLQNICKFLEIEYQPDMLNYDQHEHHVLGGNNGTQFLVAQAQREKIKSPFVSLSDYNRQYYEGHGSKIALDLRWKHELNPSIANLFEAIAGKENQELKWEV